MKEALYWAVLDKEKRSVRCALCPHGCGIADGKYGICGARKNVSGKLFSASYGELTSVNLDPIEKKPLYHFYPGAKILSVGAFGCNFKCSFCQNWEISQSKSGEAPTKHFSPEKIVEMAGECSSIGVAYTYNEPLMNYEWVKDCSLTARARGLKNVLVSNGYVNPEPLSELLPLIDAANIDVKSFTNAFYKKLCGGCLRPVLDTVEAMVKAGVHVELTTLLIPGENDSEEEIEKLSKWVAGLDRSIPLHLSRYFPSYKMDKEATGESSLGQMWSVAKKNLDHVYTGNVRTDRYSSTSCPSCGEVLIARRGYDTNIKGLQNGCCVKCGKKINVVNNGAN